MWTAYRGKISQLQSCFDICEFYFLKNFFAFAGWCQRQTRKFEVEKVWKICLENPAKIVIYLKCGMLYWCQRHARKFAVEKIRKKCHENPAKIVIYLKCGILYWCQHHTWKFALEKIRKICLENPAQIVINFKCGILYWCQRHARKFAGKKSGRNATKIRLKLLFIEIVEYYIDANFTPGNFQ
jgi:hypothetical protein